MSYRKVFYRRTRRAARLLSFVPFIRAIVLNGSLVTGKDDELSDIDFLIIAEDGHLYTVRFISALLLQIAGIRRYGNKIRGRICLNCFLKSSEPLIFPKNSRNLGKIASSNRYAISLAEMNDITNKFMRLNSWMNNYRIDGEDFSSNLKAREFDKFPIKTKNYFEKSFSKTFYENLEEKLRKYQVKRIKRGIEAEGDIVAEEDEIRLHPKK